MLRACGGICAGGWVAKAQLPAPSFAGGPPRSRALTAHARTCRVDQSRTHTHRRRPMRAITGGPGRPKKNETRPRDRINCCIHRLPAIPAGGEKGADRAGESGIEPDAPASWDAPLTSIVESRLFCMPIYQPRPHETPRAAIRAQHCQQITEKGRKKKWKRSGSTVIKILKSLKY